MPVGLPKKQMLFCQSCQSETRCSTIDFRTALCPCGERVDVRTAKNIASAERKQARVERAKELGTYASISSRKRLRETRKREVDHEYIRWIHGWGCIVCDSWPVHAHHVDKRSRLGSDRSALPICASHHIGGIHTKGEKTCAAQWGIDFEKLIKQFNERHENGSVGPHHSALGLAGKYETS